MAYPTNPSSPTDLLSALPDKFEAARQSGQLFFFPSEDKDVYSGGKRVSFCLQLRVQQLTTVQPALMSCPARQSQGKGRGA